jgi:hypothetical protein
LPPVTARVVLFVLGIFWFLPIYVAHQIGAPKHRAGFAWGLFLGWLGVLVVALLPARPKLVDPKPVGPRPEFFSRDV